jgi:hypothetical protein
LSILFKDITPQAISCHSGRAFDGFVGSTSRDIENIQTSNEQDSVRLTDHELAEHKINGLRLRDDRVFVHQRLIGIYGKK